MSQTNNILEDFHRIRSKINEIKKDLEECLCTVRARDLYEAASSYIKQEIDLRRKINIWIDDLEGPVFASIDITYRCNGSCPYCFLGAKYNSRREEMSFNLVMKTIDILKRMGTLGLCLCGGEPTLHPNFFDIISYATDQGLKVNVVSNGFTINEKYASKLSEYDIGLIQISLDGSKPNIMNSLRGPKAFEKAISAIKLLVDYGVNTVISFCSTKYNIDDFPNVVELAQKLNVLEVRTMFFVPSTTNTVYLAPSDTQYCKLIKWIKNNAYNYSIRVEFGDPTEHIVFGPLIGVLALSIHPYGYILPSPYISLAYGKINEMKLLWPRIRNLWKENIVFNTIARYLNTELDFAKLSDIIGRGINENIIDVSKIKHENMLQLAKTIKESLTRTSFDMRRQNEICINKSVELIDSKRYVQNKKIKQDKILQHILKYTKKTLRETNTRISMFIPIPFRVERDGRLITYNPFTGKVVVMNHTMAKIYLKIHNSNSTTLRELLKILETSYNDININTLKTDLTRALVQLFIYGYVKINGKTILDFYNNYKS